MIHVTVQGQVRVTARHAQLIHWNKVVLPLSRLPKNNNNNDNYDDDHDSWSDQDGTTIRVVTPSGSTAASAAGISRHLGRGEAVLLQIGTVPIHSATTTTLTTTNTITTTTTTITTTTTTPLGGYNHNSDHWRMQFLVQLVPRPSTTRTVEADAAAVTTARAAAPTMVTPPLRETTKTLPKRQATALVTAHTHTTLRGENRHCCRRRRRRPTPTVSNNNNKNEPTRKRRRQSRRCHQWMLTASSESDHDAIDDDDDNDDDDQNNDQEKPSQWSQPLSIGRRAHQIPHSSIPATPKTTIPTTTAVTCQPQRLPSAAAVAHQAYSSTTDEGDPDPRGGGHRNKHQTTGTTTSRPVTTQTLAQPDPRKRTRGHKHTTLLESSVQRSDRYAQSPYCTKAWVTGARKRLDFSVTTGRDSGYASEHPFPMMPPTEREEEQPPQRDNDPTDQQQPGSTQEDQRQYGGISTTTLVTPREAQPCREENGKVDDAKHLGDFDLPLSAVARVNTATTGACSSSLIQKKSGKRIMQEAHAASPSLDAHPSARRRLEFSPHDMDVEPMRDEVSAAVPPDSGSMDASSVQSSVLYLPCGESLSSSPEESLNSHAAMVGLTQLTQTVWRTAEANDHSAHGQHRRCCTHLTMNDWEQEQQESIPGSFRRAIMDLIIFKNDRDSTNDVWIPPLLIDSSISGSKSG